MHFGIRRFVARLPSVKIVGLVELGWSSGGMNRNRVAEEAEELEESFDFGAIEDDSHESQSAFASAAG